MRHLLVFLFLSFLSPLALFAQWRSLNGPPGTQANSIASEGDVMLVGTTNGVFRSVDGGNSWEQWGLNGRNVTHVAIARGIVFAAAVSELHRREVFVHEGVDWSSKMPGGQFIEITAIISNER